MKKILRDNDGSSFDDIHKKNNKTKGSVRDTRVDEKIWRI